MWEGILMDIWWEDEKYENRPCNGLGFCIDSRNTHISSCIIYYHKRYYMSQHVTCRSGLRCLPIAIFGAEPNSEFFCQPFGMKGPMQLWGSDRFFGCNQSGRDWYHVKGTISGILGAPDVLRVKCTSSSSTPWLDHWWHMFGMSQAATSCQMV